MTRTAKIILGFACILALILILVVAMYLDSRSPDPILGIFQTEPTSAFDENETPDQGDEGVGNPSKETDKSQGNEITDDEQLTPPEDISSSVTIPVKKDPETGEPMGMQLPCQIPEYGLVIEKMASYNGMFVEDGTNTNTENVAMLMVENKGDFPLEYTQICVSYGQEQLLFDVSALPVGEKLVVQEKSGKPMPQGNASEATATIVQRANMEMSEDLVQVTDNGNNTLTIKNLTDKTIPTVRVFYKYYMEEEGVFVGGIAFTVRITRLGAGASVTVQPSHYTSKTSRVVMVLTYDSEV